MKYTVKKKNSEKVSRRLKVRCDVTETIAGYANAIESVEVPSMISSDAVAFARNLQHYVVRISKRGEMTVERIEQIANRVPVTDR